MPKQWVFAAKKKDEKEKMKDIETDTHIIYHIAKQLKQENKDIVGEKCYNRDDNGVLAFNEEDKKKVWKQYYERLWRMSNSLTKKRICQLLIQYLDPLFLSIGRSW